MINKDFKTCHYNGDSGYSDLYLGGFNRIKNNEKETIDCYDFDFYSRWFYNNWNSQDLLITYNALTYQELEIKLKKHNIL